MSWYSKVIWSEGLFLRPQHMQQQNRHAEWLVEARARALGSFFWGFSELELDEGALSTGKVALVAARGVLPDGTPFDFPGVHPAPPALDFPADARDAIVYLALPLRRPQSTEDAQDDDGSAQLARFSQADQELVDSTSREGTMQPIKVGLPRLRLALDKQVGDAFVRIGVARITERRPDNRLLLDRGYIPPVLACRTSSVLLSLLREVQGLLRQRADALAQRVAQPGAGGVAEIAHFIYLLTLNRHQPVFDHFAELSQLHPERLFVRLLELAGELATLGHSERRPEALRAYDHDALELCFSPLMREIRRFLATVIEESAMQIELQDHKQGRYVGLITDRSLLRQAGFVLAVKAQMASETLRTHFPAQSKLGPLEKMRDLVKLQLPGIALQPLAVVPRQIPYHAGFSYFELDTTADLWKQLDNSGGLGIYVTGNFPALELALWAIRT